MCVLPVGVILLIALFDNIFRNIIIPWVGLIGRGLTVTVGFFQPIHGVRGLCLSDWGRTNIQLRHETCSSLWPGWPVGAHSCGLSLVGLPSASGSSSVRSQADSSQYQAHYANCRFAAPIHCVDHQLHLYDARADQIIV